MFTDVYIGRYHHIFTRIVIGNLVDFLPRYNNYTHTTNVLLTIYKFQAEEKGKRGWEFFWWRDEEAPSCGGGWHDGQWEWGVLGRWFPASWLWTGAQSCREREVVHDVQEGRLQEPSLLQKEVNNIIKHFFFFEHYIQWDSEPVFLRM